MTLLVHIALLLIVPPLVVGLIQKTKAWFAGRRGPPLLQVYFDVIKLAQKGAVYSRGTSWIFRAGPIVSLAAVFAAGLLVPIGMGRPPLGFHGDIFAFAALLALGRFFTIAAALDTGSSFEGMGASRAAAFSTFSEPALFLALGSLCVSTQTPSLEAALGPGAHPSMTWFEPVAIMAAIALYAITLAECSRIPFDDPNTHLELTMIHEVMVLDHGGPDFALITHASATKLVVLGMIIVQIVSPIPQDGGTGWLLLGLLALALSIGVVESTMARIRLPRVPQFLVGAAVVAAMGLAAAVFQSEL